MYISVYAYKISIPPFHQWCVLWVNPHMTSSVICCNIEDDCLFAEDLIAIFASIMHHDTNCNYSDKNIETSVLVVMNQSFCLHNFILLLYYSVFMDIWFAPRCMPVKSIDIVLYYYSNLDNSSLLYLYLRYIIKANT